MLHKPSARCYTKSFPLSRCNWVFVQWAVSWDYLHQAWTCRTLVMPVLWGKCSLELVTLQSSQEDVTMATQSTMEWWNSRENQGHRGAGDGMGSTFFLRRVSSNACQENWSLVLICGKKTQVQKHDWCTVTIISNISKWECFFWIILLHYFICDKDSLIN